MWTRRLSETALFAACALGSATGLAAPASSAPAQADLPDDPLASYRERFKLGMDRYRAGDVSEAIGYWEPIYRELGEEKGYRLAYNLGVAYQELGDATRAAERLQSFLAEFDARRVRGDAAAAIVEKEHEDARARIARLLASKGRIQIEAGTPPRTARVDASEPRIAGFVAWVTPGAHKITYAGGTPDAETRVVHVKAGELLEVAPKPAPPATTTEETAAPPPPAAPAPPAQIITRREVHHPFGWPLLAVSGGAAVTTAVLAVPLYLSAAALHDRLSSGMTISQADRDNYTSARTLAYSVMGGAVAFTALTAGLATWYLLGTSDREVVVTPTLGSERGGSLTVRGRF